jgi:hypothetical protein
MLDQEVFAAMVMALKFDLKGFAQDAKGVVVSVQGAVDDGGDHAFGVVVDEGLLEDCFSGPGFAQHEAQAALLGVDAEDVEDFLLVGQERHRFGVKGMALETKVGADHRQLMSWEVSESVSWEVIH